MSFGSTLPYSSMQLTSMIPNSSSETNFLSSVASKMKFSELMTRPHGWATALWPFNFI